MDMDYILVKKMRMGDEEAVEIFVTRFGPRVCGGHDTGDVCAFFPDAEAVPALWKSGELSVCHSLQCVS